MGTNKYFFLSLFLIVSFYHSPAQNLLSETYTYDQLKNIIVTRDAFRPFPDHSDRSFWTSLPDSLKTYYVKKGESLIEFKWPPLPASYYLEYKRMGDRRHFEGYYFERRHNLRYLMFAELIENKGRFMDQIMNGLWAICEESSWCISAHINAQKIGRDLPDPDEEIVDLFAAQTGQLLAWLDYLLNEKLDEVSTVLRKRLQLEVKRRILNPNFERTDFTWMGFKFREHGGRRPNNWNPWINSNWLACNLLLEKDEQRRVEATHKALQSIDNFLTPHPADGGCDEGPGYWNHAAGSMFDALELMYISTDGKFDVYDEPIIRNMGTFIYKAYISYPYFLNFADANAKIRFNGPHVYRYGTRIGDEPLRQFGAFGRDLLIIDDISLERNVGRHLFLYSQLEEIYNYQKKEVLVRDAWLPDIQVMVARAKEGTSDGILLAAKGGHNQESHNHNDIGNFIIYVDGEPAIMDAGRGTYTSMTFSNKRYTLWFNNSAHHNVPQINGVMQAPGRAFEASDVSYKASKSRVTFSLDLEKTYPKEAGVQSLARTFSYQRNSGVDLTDKYLLKSAADDIRMHLMTVCRVEETGDHTFVLRSIVDNRPLLEVNYDKNFEFSVEKMPMDLREDKRIMEFWGEDIYRIVLVDDNPGAKGSYTIKFEQ